MTESVIGVLEAALDERGMVTQEEIVDAVAVSKATVSRRLTDLEDNGEIIRLRVGGRKLIWRTTEAPGVMSS